MRPNLQLALDLVSLDKALHISEITLPWVDWIEAGTPLVISEGLKAVKSLKSRFPQKTIVADIKIVDAAKLITAQAISANADIITVLSAASDQSITTCVETAHQKGVKVLGDHISTQLSIDAYHRLAFLGVDYVGIHIPKDSGETLVLSSIEQLLLSLKIPAVLAGGLNFSILRQMTGWPVSAFVIGNAILNHPDPASAAQEFAAILNNWF
jgi:3-hexulose-6-phosphate synthase